MQYTLPQYQLLPLKGSVQLIEDITGHTLSTATLVNINEQCSGQLSGFIEVLKDNLQKAPVLHSDVTGFYYESKRNWLHVAATWKKRRCKKEQNSKFVRAF